MSEEQRLYCIMRSDLKAPVGKLMAQAGHAFVNAFEQARLSGHDTNDYLANQQPKIVLRARNEAILRRAAEACERQGIPHFLVVDSGRTVFSTPTTTCLGLGLVAKAELPKFIRQLQLLVDIKESQSMKYAVEGTLTEIEDEDDEYNSLVGHTQFDDMIMLAEHDGQFFVRLHSYQEEPSEGAHRIMEAMRGKRIRVTIETLDDEIS